MSTRIEDYVRGLRDMAQTIGYDDIAYCWHCQKHTPVHSQDAICKCGAPFDSTRCEEFKFFPKHKIRED